MAQRLNYGPNMPLAYLPLKAIGVASAVWLGASQPATGEVAQPTADDTASASLLAVVDPKEPITVRLHDVNRSTDDVVVIARDGSVDEANHEKIRHLFRCRRTGKETEMDRRLLVMIADLQAHYPEKTINFVSAYRGHREESKTSPHRAGRALDLTIPGVSDIEIRDYVWRTHREVGVGWYPHEGFVHIDSRPKDLAWTETHGINQYRPSWSGRVRRDGNEATAKRSRHHDRKHRPSV